MATGPQSGSAVRITRKHSKQRFTFRLDPKRTLVVRPLILASMWLTLAAATVYSLTRGQRNVFIFIPFLFIPAKNLFRSLGAVVNRATLVIGRDRVEMTNGPIPWATPQSFATKSVRVFRPIDHRAPLGGSVLTGQTFGWTIKVIEHGGNATTLDLALPDREFAKALSDELNEALSSLRTKKSYRG